MYGTGITFGQTPTPRGLNCFLLIHTYILIYTIHDLLYDFRRGGRLLHLNVISRRNHLLGENRVVLRVGFADLGSLGLALIILLIRTSLFLFLFGSLFSFILNTISCLNSRQQVKEAKGKSNYYV